jgi:hypothetical protein
MDSKEATIIKHYYDKMAGLTFGERDVLTLLILLRWYSQKNSPVYEFANFVTHREKDRGHIYDYLLGSKSFFNKVGTKLGDVHELKSVFTEQEIRASFNDVFTNLGLPTLSDEVYQGIQLCIISLLQEVKISDKGGAEIGKLLFAFDKEEIYLMGLFSVVDFPPYSHLQVPVLTMKNHYLKTESYELRTPGLVEVVNADGGLKVMVWENSAPTTA